MWFSVVYVWWPTAYRNPVDYLKACIRKVEANVFKGRLNHDGETVSLKSPCTVRFGLFDHFGLFSPPPSFFSCCLFCDPAGPRSPSRSHLPSWRVNWAGSQELWWRLSAWGKTWSFGPACWCFSTSTSCHAVSWSLLIILKLVPVIWEESLSCCNASWGWISRAMRETGWWCNNGLCVKYRSVRMAPKIMRHRWSIFCNSTPVITFVFRWSTRLLVPLKMWEGTKMASLRCFSSDS